MILNRIMDVLKLYKSVAKYPFGKHIFSMLFCLKAPYFRTINPKVLDLSNGFAAVSMSQRWSVQNHIKTVHAIAVCNLVEMCMGLVVEATIPKHLRWLPMGMDIQYKKKAMGQLTATSTIDALKSFHLQQYPGQVIIPVEVKNSEGVVVSSANIRLWISKKPEKPQ